jgi:hypothetical protein
MRYYKMVLANLAGQVYVPTASGGFTLTAPGANVSSFTSHLPTTSGSLQYNPGSLNVEFDCQIVGHALIQAQARVAVHGVGLAMIGQASNFNFIPGVGPTTTCALYGGMQQGIAGPSGLANPAQAGLLFQGNVFQGFGNWQGTNQSIELLINNSPVTPPGGISWSWTPGQPLAGALFNALTQAFPTYKVTITIANGLAPIGLQQGCYQGLTPFAAYLNEYTQPLGVALGLPGYAGVNIVTLGQTISVTDGTSPPRTIQLNFQDLVGQPTWIDIGSVNFKTVLRADIGVGDNIVFPAGVISPYALTSPNAAVPGAPSRSKTAFAGPFTVLEMHHFANYRQADADSWVTSFNATTVLT